MSALPAADFFELRNYRIEANRIDEMRARLRNHLDPLFAELGIDIVECWDSRRPGSEEFVYMVHWNSWEHRQRAWASFYADPRWHAARTATNAGSELVQRMDVRFLQAFHRAKGAGSGASRQLLTAPVVIGQMLSARQLLVEQLASAMHKRGVDLVAAFEVAAGADLPRMMLVADASDPITFGTLAGLLPVPSPIMELAVWPHCSAPYRDIDFPGRRYLVEPEAKQ